MVRREEQQNQLHDSIGNIAHWTGALSFPSREEDDED
eukprot:gene9484-11632_t